MKPLELYHRALKLGLRLERAGDMLAVLPKGKCPPEFADVLRQHKPELLAWLEAQATGLPLDQAPWLHIAKQVLAGEWDGADGSTLESLSIGLRGVRHPLAQEALSKLRGNKHRA